MAVVKSDLMTTALDLDDIVLNGLSGVTKTSSAVVPTGGALADNDVLVFLEVPVDAILESVKLASDDLGTTGDLNIGFFPGLLELKRLGKNVDSLVDTDAVDEDAIGTAIDVNAAAVPLTEIRFETKGIETANQRVWELAGLSSKPSYGKMLICATLSEATTAAGDVLLQVKHRV